MEGPASNSRHVVVKVDDTEEETADELDDLELGDEALEEEVSVVGSVVVVHQRVHSCIVDDTVGGKDVVRADPRPDHEGHDHVVVDMQEDQRSPVQHQDHSVEVLIELAVLFLFFFIKESARKKELD